jgi:hypothetical protein
MKKLIYILLIGLLIMSLGGCMSYFRAHAEEWGYVPKGTLAPVHEPLPKPVLPTLDTTNLSPEILFQQVLVLDGTVQKFIILVEIYDRELTGKPQNNAYAAMTLDQLKIKYLQLLGLVDNKGNPTTPTTKSLLENQ